MNNNLSLNGDNEGAQDCNNEKHSKKSGVRANSDKRCIQKFKNVSEKHRVEGVNFFFSNPL